MPRMSRPAFTTDDIALAIEIPGVYDGAAVYLMRDGTLVNRFRHDGFGSAARIYAADEWIAQHCNAIRARNADLLNPGVTDG